MKKILITGGNGYFGKALAAALVDQYDVFSVSRNDFDVTDFLSVNSFFKKFNFKFDAVIHCAIKGGNRLVNDSHVEMDTNLLMYYNLLQHKKDHFDKLISFGSGAEVIYPDKFFGLSKKIISKSSIGNDNFYNIRVYAVFDENELPRRFIKSSINNYINKKSITIHQDKKMDFFYMKDLVSVVKLYIENSSIPKEFECCYEEPETLTSIANFINSLSDHKVDINYNQNGFAEDYTGKFNNVGLKYVGLWEGIREMYQKILLNLKM